MSRFAPGRRVVTLFAGIGFAFLTLPLLALAIRAVQAQSWAQAAGSGLTEAVLLSLLTTTVSSLLTLVFGTPLAYVFARRTFRYKRMLNVLIELPIVLPPAVAGLALLIAFGRRGLFGPALESIGVTLPFTTVAVIVAQTFVSAPFYVRAAQVGFQSVQREIEDAARVDGASPFAVVRFVTLPLARRALMAGLVLSWARALGEFGATILFAGSLQGRTQTMPLLIYNLFERNLDAAIWTGLLLVVLALAALLLSQWLTRSDHID